MPIQILFSCIIRSVVKRRWSNLKYKREKWKNRKCTQMHHAKKYKHATTRPSTTQAAKLLRYNKTQLSAESRISGNPHLHQQRRRKKNRRQKRRSRGQIHLYLFGRDSVFSSSSGHKSSNRRLKRKMESNSSSLRDVHQSDSASVQHTNTDELAMRSC